MGLFDRIANGLGTLLGKAFDFVSNVVEQVRLGYEAHRGRGGHTRVQARADMQRRQDNLRSINEKVQDIRRRTQQRAPSTVERRTLDDLLSTREEIKQQLDGDREVIAAEVVLDNAASIDKVEVDQESVHVLTRNAFADVFGKVCPKCSRKMKLQWKSSNATPVPHELFWGCTGYYIQSATRCLTTLPLSQDDFTLATDMSVQENQATTSDFNSIVEIPSVAQIIVQRMDDLTADLRNTDKRVEIASCPVHGEAMVLRRKAKPSGLLDMYFLGCPLWLPNEPTACVYVEKLKSPAQLSALLQSETGSGIL